MTVVYRMLYNNLEGQVKHGYRMCSWKPRKFGREDRTLGAGS